MATAKPKGTRHAIVLPGDRPSAGVPQWQASEELCVFAKPLVPAHKARQGVGRNLRKGRPERPGPFPGTNKASWVGVQPLLWWW